MPKKYRIVVDVETANSLDDPLVYDLGFAVVDCQWNVVETHSYLIYEVYRMERELMQSCYYANKLEEYERKIRDSEIKLVTMKTAYFTMRRVMKKYRINEVWAYNAYFDCWLALNTTIRYVTKSAKRWWFPYGTKFCCIWHTACQRIYTQSTFQKWAVKNGFVSPAGNVQTTAEVGYRYYTKNPEYEEEHTGLADVLIEVFLLQKCFAQHKPMRKTINRMCWRVPNTKEYKEKRRIMAAGA